MKAATLTTTIKNGEKTNFHFNFNFCPAEESASIKVWEEENAEYSSWSLIVDPQDTFTC